MVAMGLLKWIDMTVSAKSYFTLNTDHTPLHLVLLDEVSYQLHFAFFPVIVVVLQVPMLSDWYFAD